MVQPSLAPLGEIPIEFRRLEEARGAEHVEVLAPLEFLPRQVTKGRVGTHQAQALASLWREMRDLGQELLKAVLLAESPQ